jgi:hypothetical protein
MVLKSMKWNSCTKQNTYQQEDLRGFPYFRTGIPSFYKLGIWNW